jgi:hypothetical protein
MEVDELALKVVGQCTREPEFAAWALSWAMGGSGSAAVSFYGDCLPAYRAEMTEQGLCWRAAWRDRAKAS